MSCRLAGKTVLITDGDSGIGQATAMLFAREGARAVFLSMDQAAGTRLEAAIRNRGGEALYVPGRFTEAASLQRLISAAVERFGSIHVLFQNCEPPELPPRRLHELDLDAMEGGYANAFDIYGKNTFRICKLVMPYLLADGGAVILLASAAGSQAAPGQALRAIYNGGLAVYVKSLSLEHVKQHVRVTRLVHGPLENDACCPAEAERLPLGRAGRAQELAYAALFLADDQCAVCTGTSLVADGALSCV